MQWPQPDAQPIPDSVFRHIASHCPADDTRPVIFNVMLGRGRGGLETAALHTATALSLKGYRVVTVGHAHGWLRRRLPIDSTFIACKPFANIDWRVRQQLRRAVAAMSPLAVLAHGNRAITYVAAVRGTCRIGVLHNLRFKQATAGLDGCIAVTHALATAARTAFSGLPVTVVPNLVNIPSVKLRPPRKGPLVIGALGRLHTDKGFDVLLSALAQPGMRERDWRLVIGGEGREGSVLRKLAACYGFGDRVRFAGWIDDHDAFFQSIDVLCMPSRVESFGIVLIEALARSVPVIASANAGASEIVTPGHDALLVPVGDVVALAGAIGRLADDEDLATRLGRNGRVTVATRYALNNVAASLESAIAQLGAKVNWPLPSIAGASLFKQQQAPAAPSLCRAA